MIENLRHVKTNFMNRLPVIGIIFLGSISLFFTGCFTGQNTIPGEGVRNGRLYIVVYRPLYAVPLGENNEFTAQIRKSADSRALQLLMAIQPEGADRFSNECITLILSTGKTGHSECGADFCLWSYSYDLNSCRAK